MLVEDVEFRNKQIKPLKQNLWYHATTMQHLQSLKNGIQVNYNKDNALDFGAGFYLTPNKEQAENYIQRNMSFEQPDSIFLQSGDYDTPIIVEYHIDGLYDIFMENNKYQCNLFPKYDERFATFIFYNRLNGEKQHDWDFIYGVQSDSNPEDVIEQYKSGGVDKEEALLELQKSTSSKQLYIGNQEFCDKLGIESVIPIIDK